MEQNHFFRKFVLIHIILGLFLALSACKSKEKNPELLDPIYRDLQSTLDQQIKLVEDTEKEIISYTNEIKEMEPNTKELHMARKRMGEAKAKLVKARQMSRYYEIRLERRRVEGRRAYSIAFDNDKEWPDPGEYSAYLANKRLRNSNPQWAARVPKLHSRLEQYQEGRTPASSDSEAPAH